MRASRGMGSVRPELTKPKKILRRDADVPTELYADGGGLYANIHAKRKRIASGSGEKMRKPNAPGAPTAQAFRQSAKTAKR